MAILTIIMHSNTHRIHNTICSDVHQNDHNWYKHVRYIYSIVGYDFCRLSHLVRACAHITASVAQLGTYTGPKIITQK